MSLFYSPASNGFFDDTLHRLVPADAVPVSAEEHARLFAAQAQGRAIRPGADGRPVAIDPPRPSLADLRANAIAAAKREAAARIACIAPLWRQLNDARALPLAGAEQRASIEARFAALDRIRAASDALEQAIATMNARALAALDVAAADPWPAGHPSPSEGSRRENDDRRI